MCRMCDHVLFVGTGHLFSLTVWEKVVALEMLMFFMLENVTLLTFRMEILVGGGSPKTSVEDQMCVWGGGRADSWWYLEECVDSHMFSVITLAAILFEDDDGHVV